MVTIIVKVWLAIPGLGTNTTEEYNSWEELKRIMRNPGR